MRREKQGRAVSDLGHLGLSERKTALVELSDSVSSFMAENMFIWDVSLKHMPQQSKP